MLAPAPAPSRWPVLAPALAVAAAAVAATAHGGYEVAAASGVPQGLVSALYPLITDGLALVAYAATHRLTAPIARGYAWTVVVVAAGLSGLAQAVLLASPALALPVEVKFGVGAWPAVAGAVAAHLVYLLARRPKTPMRVTTPTVADLVATHPTPPAVMPETAAGPVPRPRPVAASTPRPTQVNAVPTPPRGIPAVVAGEDEPSTVEEMIAAGWGRRRMVAAGVREYEARKALAEARA